MVRFAPIVLPIQRRLQTLAILFWAVQLFIAIVVTAIFVITPWLWPFTFSYILFMLNDPAPENGGRVSPRMRRLWIWKQYRDYFPLKLLKTAELPPKTSYILGYHPHGIIGVGAWGNFATEANRVSELFPGLDFRVATLASNFQIPVFRDYLMSLGLISVSKRSVRNFLAQGPGRAVVIVIGGAAEALNARPGTNDLTLRERKGFVKIALVAGASLVPIFSFGENDVYDQVVSRDGSLLRRMQNGIKRILGFTLPIFLGRGVFNYDLGLLPRRKTIVSVELVNEYHSRYMTALEQLYNEYKDVHAKDRRHDLRFVQ